MRGISKFLFAGLMLALTVACSSKQARSPVNDAGAAQPSPTVDIKSRWEQRCKELDKLKLGKDYPGKKLDLLAEILQEVPPSQFKSEVERVRKEPAGYDHMEEYDRYLLQAAFGIYAKQANAVSTNESM